MSFKRYQVVLTSRSSLKFEVRRGWKDAEYNMTIKDDLQEDMSGGSPKHAGLIYTVEVYAEHIVESIHKATSYARHITDQISVVHSVVIDYPLPQFSIDIDTAYAHRELAQILYNVPVLHQPRRTYDCEAYKTFHNNLDKLRQENPRSAKRIDRALHYLRSSYLETDPIDRFEDAWVALETINPLIRKKYSQPTTYQCKCQKCKEDLLCQSCNTAIKQPDSASGIDYAITQLLGETPTAAKELRSKRIDIVHARTELSEILSSLPEKTRLAQRAVKSGIMDILELPKSDGPKLLREILPIAGAPQIIVSATLYELSVEALKIQARYPQLHLQGCKALVNNCPEAHAGETRPLAAQLRVGLQNFSGEWDLLEVRSLLEIDPEESGPTTEIFAIKCVSLGTAKNLALKGL